MFAVWTEVRGWKGWINLSLNQIGNLVPLLYWLLPDKVIGRTMRKEGWR